MARPKICTYCGKTVSKLRYSEPATCLASSCSHKGYNARKSKKEESIPDGDKKSISRPKIKPTGELKLFLQIYSDRKGICEVTGQQIKFDVNCFAHILGKKAYPRYRLNPNNIIMVKKEIHHYYDNSGKDILLKHYPGATIIYDRKDKLKPQYYEEARNNVFIDKL